MRMIDADILGYEDIESTDGNTYMVVHAAQIDNAPTAYDVDAVVEQLENAMGLCEGFVDSANSEYEADRWTHKAETYGEAIEIVKGGGVDE